MHVVVKATDELAVMLDRLHGTRLRDVPQSAADDANITERERVE